MEPNKLDTLFAAKAVSKEINARVKALEDEVKAEALKQYLEDGTDRQRSRFFGKTAGYLTIKEGSPSEHVERFTVVNVQELIDWYEEVKPEIECFVADNIEKFAEWHFRNTGECPDGCTFIQYESEPGKPSAILTVKEKVVLPMLQEDAQFTSGISSFLLSESKLLGDGNGSY